MSAGPPKNYLTGGDRYSSESQVPAPSDGTEKQTFMVIY